MREGHVLRVRANSRPEFSLPIRPSSHPLKIVIGVIAICIALVIPGASLAAAPSFTTFDLSCSSTVTGTVVAGYGEVLCTGSHTLSASVKYDARAFPGIPFTSEMGSIYCDPLTTSTDVSTAATVMFGSSPTSVPDGWVMGLNFASTATIPNSGSTGDQFGSFNVQNVNPISGGAFILFTAGSGATSAETCNVSVLFDFSTIQHSDVSSLHSDIAQLHTDLTGTLATSCALCSKDSTLSAFQSANHTDQGALNTTMGAFQTAAHIDSGALNTSVSGFATANHSDLGAVNTTIAASNTQLAAFKTSTHTDSTTVTELVGWTVGAILFLSISGILSRTFWNRRDG